jgi:hypothetical protein
LQYLTPKSSRDEFDAQSKSGKVEAVTKPSADVRCGSDAKLLKLGFGRVQSGNRDDRIC